MILFVAIIGRMFYIVTFSDKQKSSISYELDASSKRGNIVDRNGTILATDLATKSLYANSKLIKNHDQVAKTIADFFEDLTYEEVKKKISNKSKKDWVLIRRDLTPNQVLQVNNMHVAGLVFESGKSRVYPQKSVASHLVGYVDVDRKGLSGIELSYNKILRRGIDVSLAMDIRVQDILVDELQSAIEKYRAQAAVGIVMDVTNGEVIAMVSLPNFDPNDMANVSSNNKFNRATNGVYEPGSVLKIFTNAIAFEENLLKKSDIYDVKDPIKYGKFTISDDHHVKDKMNFEEVFIHSSNIGTVKIAKKIGAKKQKSFLQKMGLTKRIESDFRGLGRPIYPRRWRDINLYTISYGHGIAITPLHIATSVSAMVNGGNLFNPTFAKRSNPYSQKRVISQETSKKIRNLLRQTALKGTGKKADIVGYEVGGKTGTAEKAAAGGYNEKETIASFVATFPTSKPKYLVYVSFDKPNVQFNTGGMVAAPAAGEIIKNIAPTLGIKPNL